MSLFLFASQPDFACNTHALWDYITKNTDHKTAWLVRDKNLIEPLRRRGIECELYDTVKGNQLAAKADYIIVNTYVFNAIPKKKGQLFVNLWHGSGIKAHDFFNRNLNLQQVKRIKEFSQLTDLMCVHSLDDRFRLSAMLNYDMRKMIVTGQPRLDNVKNSAGREKLLKVLGEKMTRYDHFIFFAPSFRADRSGHAGKSFSDNIFRLEDYDDAAFYRFLKENNTALIYKMHPIEQSLFKNNKSSLNENCFEITDQMLFDADIRYDEILNAFDVMISDYSSIAFDFLVLDRPVVYLIPDYDEYKDAKGFVFNNIDFWMPGEKVFNFKGLLSAVRNAFEHPNEKSEERKNVLFHRFDFLDGKSSERCYNAIINYKAPNDEQNVALQKRKLPTNAELFAKYVEGYTVLDSVRSDIAETELIDSRKYLYLKSECLDEYRSVSSRSSTEIADLEFYFKIRDMKNVEKVTISAGVEYEHFANAGKCVENARIRIGFIGTIDCRLYISMIRYMCEVFPEYEFVFAGDIFGDYPLWLDEYKNLKYYGQVSYNDLPDMINSLDVAILPFYGRYKNDVPSELFQYLACGKMVVTSDMPNLPDCKAILKCDSLSDCATKIKIAIENRKTVIEEAKNLAKKYDWKTITQRTISYL